ncbi:MAG: OmpA family protein [Bacteroidetes bacterium]|nr:MAG: OmpA family protein [Bacteroidota bacterium]
MWQANVRTVLFVICCAGISACTSTERYNQLQLSADSMKKALNRERYLNDRLQKYVEEIYYQQVESYKPYGTLRNNEIELLLKDSIPPADSAGKTAAKPDSAAPLAATAQPRLLKTRQKPILFAVGSTELSDEDKLRLTELADRYRNEENLLIVVEGHTDNQEQALSRNLADGWDLSAARANRVVRELITRGISADRLMAAARSKFYPAITNLAAEGRSQNRRVEFLLIERVPRQ